MPEPECQRYKSLPGASRLLILQLPRLSVKFKYLKENSVSASSVCPKSKRLPGWFYVCLPRLFANPKKNTLRSSMSASSVCSKSKNRTTPDVWPSSLPALQHKMTPEGLLCRSSVCFGLRTSVFGSGIRDCQFINLVWDVEYGQRRDNTIRCSEFCLLPSVLCADRPSLEYWSCLDFRFCSPGL